MIIAAETTYDQIAYLYDGSLEGLLTAVFAAYERRENPEDIVWDQAYQPRLGQESFAVETDFDRAKRVRRGVEKAAGAEAFRAIQRAAMCEDYETGSIVYRFIRHVMARQVGERSNPVLEDLANPVVAPLVALAKHASNEGEYMRQFVRFSHLENGVWYAKCAPNASVVPLVMGYFADRLSDQPFIIFDERHHLAGIYDGRSWGIVGGDAVNVPELAENEETMREAWKRFYDALSIDARFNPELRQHFMPQRLRANLTEMHPRIPNAYDASDKI